MHKLESFVSSCPLCRDTPDRRIHWVELEAFVKKAEVAGLLKKGGKQKVEQQQVRLRGGTETEAAASSTEAGPSISMSESPDSVVPDTE